MAATEEERGGEALMAGRVARDEGHRTNPLGAKDTWHVLAEHETDGVSIGPGHVLYWSAYDAMMASKEDYEAGRSYWRPIGIVRTETVLPLADTQL